MDPLQAPYRELLNQLGECDVPSTLSRWLAENPDECAWLERLGQLGGGTTVPELPVEDSWRLYGLSRVSDLLIQGIGSGTVTCDDFALFMLGLELDPIPGVTFHPFFHEVVSVASASDDNAEATIIGSAWPGFMCGPLLIARAGVSVSAGSSHMRKSTAESSTLYWTYRRSNRPTEDLSLGWGSNSQWRTSFRRDYAFADRFEYNVDGNENADGGELSRSQRLELVRHRCFVFSEASHADLWPYDLQHIERRSQFQE